jgi:hypothetical protein
VGCGATLHLPEGTVQAAAGQGHDGVVYGCDTPSLDRSVAEGPPGGVVVAMVALDQQHRAADGAAVFLVPRISPSNLIFSADRVLIENLRPSTSSKSELRFESGLCRPEWHTGQLFLMRPADITNVSSS